MEMKLVFTVFLSLTLVNCSSRRTKPSPNIVSKTANHIKNVKENSLNINDSLIFDEVKSYFVFPADTIPILKAKFILEDPPNVNRLKSLKQINDSLYIIIGEDYTKPDRVFTFNIQNFTLTEISANENSKMLRQSDNYTKYSPFDQYHEFEHYYEFTNYYDRLPLKFENAKLYNVPRSNVNFIAGLRPMISQQEEPYLFLPCHYYVNPQTKMPNFIKKRHKHLITSSTVSNENQVRYTGLLVSDKESYELISILVHGTGVQNFAKRYKNYLFTSIYSDESWKESRIVVWDLNSFTAIAILSGKRLNAIEDLILDEVKKQVIAINSISPKILVWDFPF